jgi:DNA-binding NtrC family response regulator
MQAKLLRALQPTPGSKSTDRTFTKVGADKETTVNVRVIAATNRNLDQRVQDGYFREDLLYRLAVINLRLPPLRERGKDITLIAESILMSINNEFREVEPGYSDKTISDEAIYLLEQQKWSGNVRALSNCLMQSAIMARADILEVSDIQAALKESPRTNTKPTTIGNDFCLESHLKGIQTEYLTKAVKQSNGTKTDAAGLVGYSNYQRLDAKLATAGLTFEEIWKSR